MRSGPIDCSNSSADDDGNITVHLGDHIPGIPANTVKLRLDYNVFPQWNVGMNMTYRSNIFSRGDENHQDVNGSVAGYFLIYLDIPMAMLIKSTTSACQVL